MRIVAKLSVPIVAIAVLAWLVPPAFQFRDWGSARAQTKIAAAKKKSRANETEKAAPKQPPKNQGRTPFTPEDEAAAAIAGIADARAWGDSDADFRRVLPQADGPWLAISGGGADGAYGAGLINGWTQSGKRPEFAMVTGASIGALIAPYAFLGARYDKDIEQNFTTITAADIFEDRQTPESLFDPWPLRRLIEKRVTAQMLAEIAAEHKRGRRLLVTTTNMDVGRRVVWNMGAIAARGDDKSLKLFRDILMASSSIPGFFPPVEIEVEANGKTFQEMHLDGTITAPFFVAPESSFTEGGPGLPTKEVYVLVNSKLTSEFSMPERNTKLILGRTISVALVNALRAELLLVVAGAQKIGITLNVATVPETFSHPNLALFDHDYMRALYTFGVEQAKNGTAFENIAPSSSDLQRGAPR
jgi:hypothetical protein